jgi:Glu-tRNA(Gln) amidotransferase subunit E-like FAD-binding protein
VPTARLSEDELAAMRHRFKVEPNDFLVILIGKDGQEKLDSRAPVTVDQLEKLIDSMPMRKREMQPEPQGEQ